MQTVWFVAQLFCLTTPRQLKNRKFEKSVLNFICFRFKKARLIPFDFFLKQKKKKREFSHFSIRWICIFSRTFYLPRGQVASCLIKKLRWSTRPSEIGVKKIICGGKKKEVIYFYFDVERENKRLLLLENLHFFHFCSFLSFFFFHFAIGFLIAANFIFFFFPFFIGCGCFQLNLPIFFIRKIFFSSSLNTRGWFSGV